MRIYLRSVLHDKFVQISLFFCKILLSIKKQELTELRDGGRQNTKDQITVRYCRKDYEMDSSKTILKNEKQKS